MFSTNTPLGDPIDRALRAYFLRFQGGPQPANWSGIEKYGSQEFVVLRNAYRVLAVYLMRENGKLAFVYEEDWPAALTKSLRPSGRDYTHLEMVLRGWGQ